MELTYKTKLKKAIRDLCQYSPSQCQILDLLIDVAVKNTIHINAKYVEDQINIKKSTTYFALNLFLKDGIIERTSQAKVFAFCPTKLEYILKVYEAKNHD